MTTATQHTPAHTYPSLRAAWIPLAALCLAFFVEMVDNTLLSIALPTIGRDLGSGTTALQWVTGAYSLTFGGLLLTAGSMADRLGRRRVLLIGLAVFGSLSLCVGLVTTAGQLIALRAALGIAAAAMAPITNSLVFRLPHAPIRRRRASFPIRGRPSAATPASRPSAPPAPDGAPAPRAGTTGPAVRRQPSARRNPAWPRRRPGPPPEKVAPQRMPRRDRPKPNHRDRHPNRPPP